MSVRRGVPAAVLSHAAGAAQLLVLGRLGSGSARCPELMLGSTTLACATHSSTPVIVVPTERRNPAGRTWSRRRFLVVGVDGSPESQAAVEFAFDEAAERNLALTAVFAWSPQDSGPLPDDALTTWREKYPGVAVTERVEHAQPAATLIRTAARAELLVVGARTDESTAGLTLGPVTQTVLRHAACPIAVVPGPERQAP